MDTNRLDVREEGVEEKSLLAVATPAVESTDKGDCGRRSRPEQEPSQTAQKRQKHESMVSGAQINALRREIGELRQKLDELVASSPSRADAFRMAEEKKELDRRFAFLRGQLDAHEIWLRDLRNLLASAPLLDFALRLRESSVYASQPHQEMKGVETTETRSNYALVDEWQKQASGSTTFSPILIAAHVRAVVQSSQQHASELLKDFGNPLHHFAVNFSSRGWAFGASFADQLLTFQARRIVEQGIVRDVALTLWSSLQEDDVLRTFAPVVQDVTLRYESETARQSAAERVLQLDCTGHSKSIVTVESLHELALEEARGWRIAVETCDDPCLIAFAAATKMAASAPTAGSPSMQSVERSLSPRLHVVMGIACQQKSFSEAVYLHWAGSVRYDDSDYVPPRSHVDLVQHLVCMMPVYEEVYLLKKA